MPTLSPDEQQLLTEFTEGVRKLTTMADTARHIVGVDPAFVDLSINQLSRACHWLGHALHDKEVPHE